MMNLKKTTPVLDKKDKKTKIIVQIANIYIKEAKKSKVFQKK